MSYSEKLVQAKDWMDYVLGPYSENMDLFKSYKRQIGYCEAIASCLNDLKQTKELAVDSLKLIEQLFIQYRNESIESIDYSVEGQTHYDEQIHQINANIDQWSGLHKMCFGELYK